MIAATLILERVFGELLLFSAVGFCILGLDEILTDIIWIFRTAYRHLFIHKIYPRSTVQNLGSNGNGHRFATFVPAWDESDVIGEMVRHSLIAYTNDNVTLFIGCYPNDPQTIDAIRKFESEKVRLVICPKDGPTTKADCLNALWRALLAEERNSGVKFKAVVLHDSEDVISPSEIRVFDHLADRFGLIQLPVLPLIDKDGPWISGHYCDEFAESHSKSMIVRESIGSALPSAGVGCAVSCDLLRKLSMGRTSGPFDDSSVTEDYELGMLARDFGWKSAFVRVLDLGGQSPVGTHAHFPCTLEAAVKQKARWMIGIGLAGWDRLGWSANMIDNWMRMRDRLAIFSSLLISVAYVTVLLGGLLILTLRYTSQGLISVSPFLAKLLSFNLAMLVWRLLVRSYFVSRQYGWLEGVRSFPRTVLGNIITVLAARRALFVYAKMLRERSVIWEKTAHKFPNRTAG